MRRYHAYPAALPPWARGHDDTAPPRRWSRPTQRRRGTGSTLSPAGGPRGGTVVLTARHELAILFEQIRGSGKSFEAGPGLTRCHAHERQGPVIHFVTSVGIKGTLDRDAGLNGARVW